MGVRDINQMTTLVPIKTRALKFRGVLLGEAAMEKSDPGQEGGRGRIPG